MTADLKSLNEIDILLAELDGRCVHEWKTATPVCFWKCAKCPTVSNGRNPAVDSPACQSLETLSDYAVEKGIKMQVYQGVAHIDVGVKMPDGQWKSSGRIEYRRYPSPSTAELHARANAVLQAREAQEK